MNTTPIASARARAIRWWWIPATLIVAISMQVVPLPEKWSLWRPNWLGLTLVYWCVFAPRHMGISVGWIGGLALDVMQFTLLGQQALSKCLIAFIASRFGNRIRGMAIAQQIVLVFVLLVFDGVLISLVQVVFLKSPAGWQAVTSSMTAVLLWPLMISAFGIVGRRHDMY